MFDQLTHFTTSQRDGYEIQYGMSNTGVWFKRGHEDNNNEFVD